MSEDSVYLSYADLRKITRMPAGTLYGLVSTKRIPHVRLGPRHVIFPKAEVLAWLEQHKVQVEVEEAK